MSANNSPRFSIAGYDGTAVTLIACSGYAVLTATVLVQFDLPTAVRIPLALPLVLFVPGFCVVSALFPPVDFTDRLVGSVHGERHPAFGFATGERFVLSVIASVVVVPVAALVANPLTGIELAPVLAGVAAVTVLGSVVAILRIRSARGTLTRPHGRSGLDGLDVARPAWDGLTIATALLVAVLLFSSAAVSLTGTGQQAPETQFYVGNPSAVPDAALSDGGSAAVELRIAHDLDASQRYTVVVARGTVEGSDGGPVENLTEVTRTSTTVASGATSTVSHTVNESAVDDASTVTFLLYTGSGPVRLDPDDAHRSLRLSLNRSVD
jgi:hypothetical protein